MVDVLPPTWGCATRRCVRVIGKIPSAPMDSSRGGRVRDIAYPGHRFREKSRPDGRGHMRDHLLASKQPKVVAIVDDDPSMLKGIERLLGAHGFVTEVFTSAEAFLEGAAASKATCLVLDIHLGGSSGIELRRQLAASGSQLAVIFMTAVDDSAIEQEALDTGCIAFLRKP